MTSPINAAIDKACGLTPEILEENRRRLALQDRQSRIIQDLISAAETWHASPTSKASIASLHSAVEALHDMDTKIRAIRQ